MTDYTLYYWPLPFRGQFVRAVLAHVGATWNEVSFDDINAQRLKSPADQSVPHMGPPVLIDHANDFAVSQTAAILLYLGRKHELLPSAPEREAMTVKIIADADDVLYEMTRYNGAQMWTPEDWQAYLPRLKRWMEIFEQAGLRHGLTAGSGTLLGTDAPSVADFTASILWSTMTDKFPSLRPLLGDTAPALAALCDRIAALPEQEILRIKSDAEYGDAWCAGQIEASLRAVL